MKTRNIILFLIGLLAFSSCQDMFEPADLNRRQLNDLTEESAYAYGLLIYGYDRLPYLTTTETDVATDDAVINSKSGSYWNMATTEKWWRSDNDPMSQWKNCKDGIQYINLFLTIVDKVKWAPSSASKQQMFVDRLKGEAYGLRALLYYYLLMAHGGYTNDGELLGVPLLTAPEDGSSNYNLPRASFADCINQIFADCDQAIELLPYDYKDVSSIAEIPEKYRENAQVAGFNLVLGDKAKNLVSARVAEAIKAQAALLAASPAFRDKSGVTPEKAAEYCANVLKHNDGLDGFDETGNVDWYMSSYKTVIEGTSDIKEILWRADRVKNNSQEGTNFPPTLFGSGRVNPSQNLVDAFPMRNGYPISDDVNSGYDKNDPYANRDPRLANTVIYNGMKYRQSEIISGTYANNKGETDDNLERTSTSTRTGYYLKKLLREDCSVQSSSPLEQQHIYPRIRYTEIYLAFAEAANEAWGPKEDPKGYGFTAYDVIKKIRQRGGIGKNEIGIYQGDPYLDACAESKDEMRELIRNERRIELCFENKRFWDLRRWKMALDEPVMGMKIEKIDADKPADPSNLTYTRIEVEKREFNNSYQCYGPIPKEEVLKWDQLKQNKGW